MTQPPDDLPALEILPYERRVAQSHPWDPRTTEVAARVAAFVAARRPGLALEHIGSTAVPGLPGKGIVDLSCEADPADIPAITEDLLALGFQRQPGPDPWPPTRPMLVGAVIHDGTEFRIHLHVQPRGGTHPRDLAFRDALRSDPELLRQYADLKTEITGGSAVDAFRYTHSKTTWILGVYRQLGFRIPAIPPPATIGILGGGQLGRMLAMAARAMGYRIAILDPDPACPAAAVADHLELGTYDDLDAARRLAARSDVLTYELEHVSLAMVQALDHGGIPVRPGPYALKLTQDRLAERRYLETSGAAVAPWRDVAAAEDLQAGIAALGLPLRLKASLGGYDGRSQVRIGAGPDGAVATADLARAADFAAAELRAGRPLLLERELPFVAELSVIVARGVDGVTRPFPVARNRHDDGILVESSSPAGIPQDLEAAIGRLGADLATGMGLVGLLTVELFLLDDGTIVVNELAPRVHNSGHWSIEGAATSQFEQHIRAICGLPLGDPSLTVGGVATANVLGAGPRRVARPTGVDRALAGPGAHVHLYDKRGVFERRKMGHVTAVGPTVSAALEAAVAARDEIGWAEATSEEGS